jgi:hypothetical protein
MNAIRIGAKGSNLPWIFEYGHRPNNIHAIQKIVQQTRIVIGIYGEGVA